MAENDFVGVMQNGAVVQPAKAPSLAARKLADIRDARSALSDAADHAVCGDCQCRYVAEVSGWEREPVYGDEVFAEYFATDDLAEARGWVLGKLNEHRDSVESAVGLVQYLGGCDGVGHETIALDAVPGLTGNPHHALARLSWHCEKLREDQREAQMLCLVYSQRAADEGDREVSRDLLALADMYAKCAGELDSALDDYGALRAELDSALKESDGYARKTA